MTTPAADELEGQPRATVLTASLPEEMLSQSCHRVRLASLTMAVLWFLVAGLNVAVLLIYPDQREGLEAWPTPGVFVSTAGMAVALLMAWAAGRPGRVSASVLDAGLLFEVVTGLLIAVLTQWQPAVVPMRISWLCVLVVAYPAIAPTTPRKTLIASLVTVSMDPLFYLVALLRGVEPDPTVQRLIWMFAPNYACAVLSVVPAHVIRQLGRQVKRARDLGSYRLGGLLGSGGMGDVYRAQHQLLVRPAAIKLIKPDALGFGESRRVAVERFRREAQAAALLQSPHTIVLYDYGATDDGSFYYAMELLDGVSLEQLVERFGPLPAERAAHLMRQACESLAEAHGRGLIHRDIKPSNLFATRLGIEVDFVKVLDFGLVKFDARAAQASPTLTAPQMATGTPAFMAPEAALGERTADCRMDVYSLGCVGYWLLTGQLVFDGGDSPTAAMVRHVTDTPERPSRRTELPIPADLEDLIMACLAKKADDRPASAEALAEALAAIPFGEPWTRERARHWWNTHMPRALDPGVEYDAGTVMPRMASE